MIHPFEYPLWVQEAKSLPVAFCQVREDALLDDEIVQQFKTPIKMLMVASGGCTAAFLATQPQIQELVLVDPNPAQMALTRLKLLLLKKSKNDRLQILGHLAMPPEFREKILTDYLDQLALSKDIFGPLDLVAREGVDAVGRYERVFAQLRRQLTPIQPEIDVLLSLRDPIAQKEKLSLRLKKELEAAFEQVMDLRYLVHLFSAEATQNSILSFSQHFFLRTLYVLETLPATENPYLQQVLGGRFLDKLYPWLEQPPCFKFPKISCEISEMAVALQNAKSQQKTFQIIHLSNILDWLSKEEAQKILKQAFELLSIGGFLVLRQLNSSLDIRQLGSFFQWQEPLSTSCYQKDRSYFYRKIHLGKKSL